MQKNNCNTSSKITECNAEGMMLSLRLSASEAQQFKKLLEESGLNKTDFIKQAIFSEKVSFLDGGKDLFVALAECAEEMRKIYTLLSRKNISDIGINRFLIEIKEQQRSLAFRFSDIEKRIADIFDRLADTEGRDNNDSEELYY